MPNRLADATSPYLQQHAHNPIEWWPWCAEAFEEARRRDVATFISIGYSACHWCHVMAHESFEDVRIANLVNERLVAIKVDREEHAAVDAAYMRATMALTGSGGWPMSVFATPDGAPFFAGTYFPPGRRGHSPGFDEVVVALTDAWRDRREEVLGSAATIVGELARLDEPSAPTSRPRVADVVELAAQGFDPINAGWGTAPKFPPFLLLDALLVKGDPGSLDLTQRTLAAMARGGIHDQVGGGFHRYSVDPSWVVPHFEKMLYDNALALGTFTRAWRRTADHEPVLRPLFERVVHRLVDWLVAEMRLDSGAFAASLDADSADIRGMVAEGIFYVWSPDLLVDALGQEDGDWAAEVFHVTTSGTFEHGLSTLQLRGHPETGRLDRVLDRLAAVRAGRFRPARDDKVVAAWNGWLIDSLVQAAGVFGRGDWLDLARAAADELWRTHWVDGALRRTSRDGAAGTAAGLADDYGAVALAFARLAGATGESAWLERAREVLDVARATFTAPDGGFFDAPEDAGLFSRPRDLTDNVTPSGTSALVAALRLVGKLAEDDALLDAADAAAPTMWPAVEASPRFAGAALADLAVTEEAGRGLAPAVVVIVDDQPDAASRLVQAAWRMAPAGSAILVGRPGTTGFGEWFAGRGTRDGQPTAYVCRGTTCFEPVTDWRELKDPLWRRV